MANIYFKNDKIKKLANNLFLDWSGDPGETGWRAGSDWKITLKCLKNPKKNCVYVVVKLEAFLFSTNASLGKE